MEIAGRLLDNLQAAVASARRLNGHLVYQDTLTYWRQILKLSRAERETLRPEEQTFADSLIDKLQQELAERDAL